MQTESEFNKKLKETLELFEYHKIIEWWERLQSGKVQTVNMGWVQLCRKSTPDWIVTFYNQQGNLLILFIEGKSDSGMLIIKEGQVEFEDKFNSKRDFKVIRTNSVEDVKNFILANTEDKMQLWSKEVDLFMSPSQEPVEEELW